MFLCTRVFPEFEINDLGKDFLINTFYRSVGKLLIILFMEWFIFCFQKSFLSQMFTVFMTECND